jgi:lysophospholipase L1-like esterase
MTIRIRAFGACMIGGFPHRYEDSCFHLATERLRHETGRKIETSIYTFGGFPITRVLKHLPSRCLAADPNIVVLQFGSSDLVVPIRKKRHYAQLSADGQKKSIVPATPLYQLRWRLRGIIGDVLRLPSVTLPAAYLDCLDQMIRAIAAHSAIPVVLSPFVLGAQRSNRFARACAPRLREIAAAVPTARFVDVYSALDRHPRRKILLSDGTHLALAGQKIVGDCLCDALREIVRD